MSLIDPDAARRERESRPPTARELVPSLLAALLLPALPAYLLPRMFTNADEHNVFDAASALGIASTFIAAVALILSAIFWITRTAGHPQFWNATVLLGLALIGAGTGLTFTPPPPAWLTAPSSTGLPFIVLGVVVIVLTWAWHRRRLSGIAAEEALMRASAPVTGTVSSQGYDVMTTEASALITRVTYAFDDAQGQRRYAQLRERIPVIDPIVEGERVDVWFDRQNPADLRRIVVRRRPRGER